MKEEKRVYLSPAERIAFGKRAVAAMERGMTIADIAVFCGVSGTCVSKRIRTYKESLEQKKPKPKKTVADYWQPEKPDNSEVVALLTGISEKLDDIYAFLTDPKTLKDLMKDSLSDEPRFAGKDLKTEDFTSLGQSN